jgi:hypothetical protein
MTLIARTRGTGSLKTHVAAGVTSSLRFKQGV